MKLKQIYVHPVSFVYLFSIAFLLIYYSCNIEVNQNVRIENGEKHTSDINTVNGSIIIGENCSIEGDCRSINGSVEVGSGSSTQSLSSVNGHISIAQNVKVNGEVNAINGNVKIKSGTIIREDVSVLNNSIEISGADLNKNLSVDNGDVFLKERSTIRGDILINTEGLIEIEGSLRQTVIIEISGGSVVNGNINVGRGEIQAKVKLTNGGKVLGKIINAEVESQDL